MAKIKQKISRIKTVEEAAKEVVEDVKNPISREVGNNSMFEFGVVSTGSTLLDLAISGGVIRGGGLPSGILVEIFGPASSGKTAILSEIAASVQLQKGEVKFKDPEGRFNKEYAKIYGVELNEEDYSRPDTVKEMFGDIWKWEPKNTDKINMIAGDSLAALSTEMEMEDQDKMGMKRAKDFSEALRKTCRMIANNNWLIVCSNQERDGTMGPVTPGGRAIPYYSSVRIRIAQAFQGGKVKKKVKLSSGAEVERVIGVKSICDIKKNSVDNPFRTVPVYIMFGVGVDDVRGNLQWLKEMTKSSNYMVDGLFDKGYKSIQDAIAYIEDGDFEKGLREAVIKLWEEIENKFIVNRKAKVRF